MKRHNENQKMDLRLKDQAHKREKLVDKGERERAEMDKLSKLKFRIGLSYILREPKKYSSFTVYLHAPLNEQEIRERMIKGFGDI